MIRSKKEFRMTRDEFDNYCSSLKSTTNVVQWGNSSVWKVGGKVFAIHSGNNKDDHKMSTKCSELNYQILLDLPGIHTAPYLKKGNWVQITTKEAMNNEDSMDYIKSSYEIIAGKLTKKLKAELGIK